MSNIVELSRNGITIKWDTDGVKLISLTQLWKMAGCPNEKRPSDWVVLPDTQEFLQQIQAELNTGLSGILGSKRGRGGGTVAHQKIALKYAAYLSKPFESWVYETIGRVIEGDSDLAADIMIRDHNRDRVKRAKKRVLVAETNKQTASLAIQHGISPSQAHNDRYKGLYRKTAARMRKDAGLEGKQTPLDVLSTYDLTLNSLANQMAEMAGQPDGIFDAANNLREAHNRTVGKPLEPQYEVKRLRPHQARAIAYSPEYQGELPL